MERQILFLLTFYMCKQTWPQLCCLLLQFFVKKQTAFQICIRIRANERAVLCALKKVSKNITSGALMDPSE